MASDRIGGLAAALGRACGTPHGLLGNLAASNWFWVREGCLATGGGSVGKFEPVVLQGFGGSLYLEVFVAGT